MRHFPRLICLVCLLGCSSDPKAEDGAGGTSSGGTGGGTGGSGTGASTGNGGGGNYGPVDPSCSLPEAAFCDAFASASPGGRAGDLDDAKWSFARLGFGCAPTGFAFPASPINVCGVWNTVNPGGPDSAFCVTENNDPRWTEGFNDNTSFNYLDARIRQPFDFEGRTGTIQWEADARTSGSHGWWVETWITEDPVPGANLHDNQLVSSKNAIGIVLALNCGAPAAGAGTSGSGKVGVERIILVKDYQVTDIYDPFSGPNANNRCVTTEQGELNKVQFKLSKDRIEVFATNVGGTELIPMAEADMDLGFTRGYVHLSHVHYNAHKAEVTPYQSYQWARVAFDGPVLATPRAYEIADPLSLAKGDPTNCVSEDVFRISYGVTDNVVFDLGSTPDSPIALTFDNVDPSGAVGAHLGFNTTFVAAGDTLKFRFNGKAWRDYVVPAINTTWERQGFHIPVPVEDLISGTNSLELGTTSVPFNMPPNSMQVANIDLEVDLP
jgi:hypothetical protein